MTEGINHQSFFEQSIQEGGDVGFQGSILELLFQRGDDFTDWASVAAVKNRGPRFVEHQHPFRKHKLMLLPETIPAISSMTREHRPADGRDAWQRFIDPPTVIG